MVVPPFRYYPIIHSAIAHRALAPFNPLTLASLTTEPHIACEYRFPLPPGEGTISGQVEVSDVHKLRLRSSNTNA